MTLQLNGKVGMSGRFKLTAIKPDGTTRHLAEFDNMILDSGLEFLTADVLPDPLTYLHIGTSSAPVSPTQSGLQAWSGSSPVVGQGTEIPAQAGVAPDYAYTRVVFRRIGLGRVFSVSEMGMGPNQHNAQLFCRALVLDDNGEPTTVTVNADEVLDVSYTLRMFVDLSDKTAVLHASGVDYTLTVRPARVDRELSRSLLSYQLFRHASAWVSGAVQPPILAGSFDPSLAVSRERLSNGKDEKGYFVEGRVFASLTGGNLSVPIRTVLLLPDAFPAWTVGFEPGVPKTASEIFSVTLRIYFGRR